MPMTPEFKQFLSQVSAAEHVPRPESEDWSAMIARISTPGKIVDIDEETYFYFLEVLPPKYMNSNLFAFAEGAEPLRLFWRKSGQHFCRELTWDETKQFCTLAHVPFPYWF